MTQLHVPMNPRLYQNLKIAIRELGYAGFCEWGRDMARRTIERARREGLIDLKSEVGNDEAQKQKGG